MDRIVFAVVVFFLLVLVVPVVLVAPALEHILIFVTVVGKIGFEGY